MLNQILLLAQTGHFLRSGKVFCGLQDFSINKHILITDIRN
jgi:hypothetical protein